MNNKKLIAIDLDGTLLTDNKKIKFSSVLYLKKLERKGNIVLISTGRPPRSSLCYYNQLKLHGPIITYNGAYIFNPNDANFKSSLYTIKKEAAIDIYDKFIGKNFDSVLSETLDTIFVDEERYFLFTINEIPLDTDKMSLKKGSISQNLNVDPILFVMHFNKTSKENSDEVIAYVRNKYPYLDIEVWGNGEYGDLHVKNINKANSIREIKEKYAIKDDDVITFGDSVNDLAMINEFKHGYAMKNCNPRIASLVNQLTKKDNNHNGVVSTIKEIINSEK